MRDSPIMRERSGLKAKPHSAMQTHQKRKGALKRSQSEEKLIERWAFLFSVV